MNKKEEKNDLEKKYSFQELYIAKINPLTLKLFQGYVPNKKNTVYTVVEKLDGNKDEYIDIFLEKIYKTFSSQIINNEENEKKLYISSLIPIERFYLFNRKKITATYFELQHLCENLNRQNDIKVEEKKEEIDEPILNEIIKSKKEISSYNITVSDKEKILNKLKQLGISYMNSLQNFDSDINGDYETFSYNAKVNTIKEIIEIECNAMQQQVNKKEVYQKKLTVFEKQLKRN